MSFTCQCVLQGCKGLCWHLLWSLRKFTQGKLYFQANSQVQTEIQNADIYPHVPVGVGTTLKADPAVAPVAIEAASGVAVPPPMRQMRRAMHVDAVSQDSATDMMVPKILPQHLVVGSRVEGLFKNVHWFPGKIEAIRPGKTGIKQIVVLCDDGSCKSHW